MHRGHCICCGVRENRNNKRNDNRAPVNQGDSDEKKPVGLRAHFGLHLNVLFLQQNCGCDCAFHYDALAGIGSINEYDFLFRLFTCC